MHRVLISSMVLLAAGCVAAPISPPAPALGTPEAAAPGAPPAAPGCDVVPALSKAGADRDAAYSALDAAGRSQILLTLPDCLENPDPAIRDGYAFEMSALILRGGDTDEAAVRTLMTGLLDRLARAEADPNGFRGPFAALALAEVARVDRITPFLSEEERWDLLMAAAGYLEGLTDYRGFSDTEGWRHGIAHTADLLMQMSLNPHLTKPQAEVILSAIASQAGPTGHAYIFGESDRLAAPVIYLAFKETFTAEEWSAWFLSLWPPEDPLRETAYTSEAALTKLHNLRAFTRAVYVSAVASKDERLKPVAGAAFAFLNLLP